MTLPRDISLNARRLAAVVGALLLLAAALLPFDRAIVVGLQIAHVGPTDAVLHFLDRWVPRMILTASVVLGAVRWIRGRPGHRADGLLLLIGPLLANYIAGGVKTLVGRARPQVAIHEGLRILVPLTDDRSFPSGHVTTTTAFALALFVAYPRSRWRFLGLMLVPLMMWDRVALAVHYPSDTVVGVALATVVIFALRRGLRILDFPVPRGWRVPLLFAVGLFISGMAPDPLEPRDPGTDAPYRVVHPRTRRDSPRFILKPARERVAMEPFLGPPLHLATLPGLRARVADAVPWGLLVVLVLLVFPRGERGRTRALRAGVGAAIALIWGLLFLSGRLPADRFRAPYEAGIFVDTHVHGSDPVDGAHGFRSMLRRSRARGVHVTALTNHDASPPTHDALPGLEWSGQRHPNGPLWHLVLLGGDGAFAAVEGERDPVRAIEVAKGAGAVVLVAHYWTWGARSHGASQCVEGAEVAETPSPEELIDAGADGFEVANRAPLVARSARTLVNRLDGLCRERGLLRVAVSDGHGIPAGSPCVSFLPGRFSDDASRRRREVLEHLERREEVVPVIFRPSTRLPLERSWARVVAFPVHVAEYFRAIGWKQRTSWLFWFVLAWPLLRSRRGGAPREAPTVTRRGGKSGLTSTPG